MKITDEAVPNALRNALTAALPHLPLSYEVKQLEWVDAKGVSEATEFGRLMRYFAVHVTNGKGEYSWTLEFNGKFFRQSKTLDEAKSIAQADFERRVRECIVGGLDVAEVRRQALEEAATLIDEGFGKVVSKSWRNDGKPSKNDICPHDKFMYEDCEQCASTAIRALAAVKEYLTTRAEAAEANLAFVSSTITDIANELGCNPYNEEILQTIFDMKSKLAEYEKQQPIGYLLGGNFVFGHEGRPLIDLQKRGTPLYASPAPMPSHDH